MSGHGLGTVAGGLLGLGAAGAFAAAGAVLLRRHRPYLADGLLLALDGPAEPVVEALRLGYAGIEICLRRHSGTGPEILRLAGSAFDDDPGATFGHAVLEPLARLGAAKGYAWHAEPFLLLIRLRPGDGGTVEQAYELLDRLLRPHAELLTRSVGGLVTQGAVTVVLTGSHRPRLAILGAYERYAFLEGSFADLEPGGLPVAVAPMITESLTTRLGWDPWEEWPEFPPEARHIIRSLVWTAHAGGRRVRFVDVPEQPRRTRLSFWRELRAADADLIASSHRWALARFLRRPAVRTHKHRAERCAAAITITR